MNSAGKRMTTAALTHAVCEYLRVYPAKTVAQISTGIGAPVRSVRSVLVMLKKTGSAAWHPHWIDRFGYQRRWSLTGKE